MTAITDLLAAHPLICAVRDKYGLDYAERAAEECDYAGMYESECLGGDMGVRSRFLSAAGADVLDDAEQEALDNFDRVLAEYFAEAARFIPGGRYEDACEHASNEYDPGKRDDDVDAYERIVDAHWQEIHSMQEAA